MENQDNKPTVTANTGVVLVKQPITTLLPQLREGTALLPRNPKTPVEAILSNPNSIAGLVRQCDNGAVAVDMALVRILKEVFLVTLSPVLPDQLAAMAEMLRCDEVACQYRFEEIAYFLKRGIGGHYGKIVGHPNYQHIAEWKEKYGQERDEAWEKHQRKRHEETTSKHFAVEALAAIPKDVLDKIAEKAQRDEKLHRPSIPDKEMRARLDDGAKLAFIEKYANNFKTKRLLELQFECKEKNWPRTHARVTQELMSRVSPGVRKVAEKIAAGAESYTAEELQIQDNYPLEIEVALQSIQKNESEENSEAPGQAPPQTKGS